MLAPNPQLPHHRPIPNSGGSFPESILMDAPICKICGEKHWSRLCNPVTKGVTSNAPVTKIVTPRQADLEADNKRLVGEVARLTEEVRALKQELAGKAPMSAAERQRKRRAKT
jgi:hypothetical protein